MRAQPLSSIPVRVWMPRIPVCDWLLIYLTMATDREPPIQSSIIASSYRTPGITAKMAVMIENYPI